MSWAWVARGLRAITGGLAVLSAGLTLAASSVAGAATWSMQHNVSNGLGPVAGMSCTSAEECFAVGAFFGPTVSRWNGVSWQPQRLPKPPAGSESGAFWGASAISCAAGDACVAVGVYDRYPQGQLTTLPFAERWDGARWSLLSVPRPPGTIYTDLNAVSCSSSDACTAVGDVQVGEAGPRAFAVRWDGSKWTIQRLPNLVGAVSVYLTGVSCTHSRFCMAVGYVSYGSVDAGQTLAVEWNGTRWTVLTSPSVTGGLNTDLLGVSCTSGTACMAVGDYGPGYPLTTQATLAERWNGTFWAIMPTPNASGLDQLSRVSCSSGDACTAVGDAPGNLDNYLESTRTLAERWDGSSWTIQPTRNASSFRVGGSWLDAVSCPSRGFCMAGGYDQDGDPLLEDWTVLDSRFRILEIRTHTDGMVSLSMKVPDRGSVDVLETAWNDNLARVAILQPAPHRFVFARAHMHAASAGELRVLVKPNAHGRLLVHHHTYRVTIRLWVTYAPTGGLPRSEGIYGLHIPTQP